jgi:hypothetical protein
MTVFKKFIPWSIVLLLFFFMQSLNQTLNKPKFNIDRSEAAINFNSYFLKVFSFGNKRFYSSILWTHTLLSGDIAHYKDNNLSSWMFLRFEAITDLDPGFRQAYFYGGQYLSIIKDDVFGAESIFLKGLKEYPNDFWLLYHAAFNYYFEINDRVKGLAYFKKLKSHPENLKHAPGLSSLVATMMARSGELAAAIKMLQIAFDGTKDGILKSRFNYLLKSAIIQQDLLCLNESLDKCHQLDPYQKSYVKQDGLFISQSKWRKFDPRPKKRVRKKQTQFLK